MTHIAIEEELDAKWADWMEKVSDDQCQGTIALLTKMETNSASLQRSC